MNICAAWTTWIITWLSTTTWNTWITIILFSYTYIFWPVARTPTPFEISVSLLPRTHAVLTSHRLMDIGSLIQQSESGITPVSLSFQNVILLPF